MTSRRTQQRTPLPPGFRPERNDDDSVMSGGMFAIVAIVAFFVLLFLAIRFGTASIESDIESRANGLLAANDLTTVNAEATGTEVLLTGSIEEGRNSDAIFAAVGNLTGVTSVVGTLWEVSNGEEEEIIITGDSVEIEWNGQVVTVRGDLSTEERKEFMTTTLDDAFFRVNVDEVNSVEGLADEGEWIGSVLSLALFAKDLMPQGLIVVSPDQELIVLSGTVEDKTVRNDLNSRLVELAATIGFDANPAVRVPENLPTKEEVEALQVDLNALLEDKVVEFRVNSDEITDAGRALLDEILATLQLAPEIRIEIGGHADSQGTVAANQALSEARAMAVLAYLVDQGEDSDRFDVIAYGDTVPIAPNDTEEGRARNRRIEFTALLAEETDE